MPTVVPRKGSCLKKWVKYWSLSCSPLLCLHAVSQWNVLWGMGYFVIQNINYISIIYVVTIFQRTIDQICLWMMLIHWSQWLHGVMCGTAADHLLGLWVRTPPQGHRCLSLVSIVCCQVEVVASDWSLIQRSPTKCGVSNWMWSGSLDLGEAMTLSTKERKKNVIS